MTMSEMITKALEGRARGNAGVGRGGSGSRSARGAGKAGGRNDPMRMEVLGRAGRALAVLSLAAVIPLAGRQAEKTRIQFAPAAGTELVYTVNGQAGVEGKNLLGADLSLNGLSMGELRIFVKAVGQDNVLTALTSSGIEVRVQTPDRTVSQNLKTKDGQALDVTFNRSGKVVAIANDSALTEARLLNYSIPQILRDYFPSFPPEPVARGDQWKESRRLSIPFQGLELQVDLVALYTLDDVFPTPQGRVAAISASYLISVSGAKDLGGSTGVFEGTGTGTGFLNLLVDGGYFTEYRIDFKTDAAFVMKQGTQRLMDFPFRFSVVADVNLLEARAR